MGGVRPAGARRPGGHPPVSDPWPELHADGGRGGHRGCGIGLDLGGSTPTSSPGGRWPPACASSAIFATSPPRRCTSTRRSGGRSPTSCGPWSGRVRPSPTHTPRTCWSPTSACSSATANVSTRASSTVGSRCKVGCSPGWSATSTRTSRPGALAKRACPRSRAARRRRATSRLPRRPAPRGDRGERGRPHPPRRH